MDTRDELRAQLKSKYRSFHGSVIYATGPVLFNRCGTSSKDSIHRPGLRLRVIGTKKNDLHDIDIRTLNIHSKWSVQVLEPWKLPAYLLAGCEFQIRAGEWKAGEEDPVLPVEYVSEARFLGADNGEEYDAHRDACDHCSGPLCKEAEDLLHHDQLKSRAFSIRAKYVSIYNLDRCLQSIQDEIGNHEDLSRYPQPAQKLLSLTDSSEVKSFLEDVDLKLINIFDLIETEGFVHIKEIDKIHRWLASLKAERTWLLEWQRLVTDLLRTAQIKEVHPLQVEDAKDFIEQYTKGDDLALLELREQTRKRNRTGILSTTDEGYHEADEALLDIWKKR